MRGRKVCLLLEKYEYWNSYVLPKFEFVSQFCLFITEGTSERIAVFHDAYLRWCDGCCYSLVRYISQVTNCDVDSIFQQYVLCKSWFERSTVWWRTLRLKFGGDPYCKLSGFFHFLPHRDSAFSVSAERTPVRWLRKAHNATGNKPGNCVWCGMGYWILKAGDFFDDGQYHFRTLFALSYGFYIRNCPFCIFFSL